MVYVKKIIMLFILLIISIIAFSQNNDSIKNDSILYIDIKSDTASLKLQEVIISTKKYPLMTKVGTYEQPLWTTIRMFPSTRVYVMNPSGTVMYEKWFDIRESRTGPDEIRMRDEFTFGLGNRIQLDLYSHTVYDGYNGYKEFKWRGFSWEVRYAVADWGKVWGNPTIYFEHKFINGRWGIEPKILLGDRIGKDGIFAINFIYEGNIGKTKESQEREYACTASYGKIINNDLTIGVSNMYRYNDYDDYTKELYIGPLLQCRFNNKSYISAEYMPGLTQDSKKSRSLIIFGWRF